MLAIFQVFTILDQILLALLFQPVLVLILRFPGNASGSASEGVEAIDSDCGGNLSY